MGGYIQGAGATVMVNRSREDPSLGVGMLIGERYNSETMVVNTRFFGHALSAIEIAGGKHASFMNNILGENSLAMHNASSGVHVRAGVSDFIIQGNHIGSIASATHKYGIEVEDGKAKSVQGNVCDAVLGGRCDSAVVF